MRGIKRADDGISAREHLITAEPQNAFCFVKHGIDEPTVWQIFGDGFGQYKRFAKGIIMGFLVDHFRFEHGVDDVSTPCAVVFFIEMQSVATRGFDGGGKRG